MLTASLLPALTARKKLPLSSICTTTGSFLVSIDLALDLGRSTSMPRVSSGAVTMKMINSTSITSMYGTTLISDLSLRLRRRMTVPDMTGFLGYARRSHGAMRSGRAGRGRCGRQCGRHCE
ncbi:hypothetical protein D3C71_1915960 [compost metagenome]